MLDIFNALFLSRIQFAFVVSFHIIFPAFTIGLASWLAVLEFMSLKTKHPVYMEIYKHWSKIFAVAFGMGVVSGVVMSYQFGTNWSNFSQMSGNVIGPVLALEVLTAFFLEASFLGIMLFGLNRVGPKLHFTATLLVAIGTVISAFWILSVNSWMQTPAGFKLGIDNILYPTNWLQIIFNPSFIYRFFHMLLAAYLCTAFVVAGVAAWYFLKNKYIPHAKIMFSMAMIIAVMLPIAQITIGHEHGVETLKYQPAKVAAIEGIWETEAGADLNLFGIPDDKLEVTKYAVKVPKLASIILTGSSSGVIRGLKHWPKEERPPSLLVFLCFRVMVGIGMLMLFTGAVATYLYYSKKLFSNKLFHKWCILMAPTGFIAILSGWIVTEVGRQPYVIYGLLKTADAVSAITTEQVSISLIMFLTVYSIVFVIGVMYIIKLIAKGPLTGDWHDAYGTHGLNEVPKIADLFSNSSKR